MVKTSGIFERDFINTAKEKTGKTIEQWLPVLKISGLSDQQELTHWLKAKHKLNHLQASLLAGMYLNNGEPVYQNTYSLLDHHFIRCESMRPLFNDLSAQIFKLIPSIQLIPKKTHFSYTVIREFAVVLIRPNEIYLGLDLGETPFDAAWQKASAKGPSPRISHFFRITDMVQFDQKCKMYVQLSYSRSRR